MAWTKDQQQAIDLEGKNIIVSAGAGSGKTAVLTARVIRKLKSNTHINELLVLTFTNAAAEEMKERIRREINKTEGLENEANLIDSAYITTFDSFSLSIVKKYHTKLNITNKIKISDEVLIDIQKNKILDKILEENYLSPKQDFIKLINNFCLKDDKELKKYILNIYKKIELKYDKTLYLQNYFNEEYTKEKINKYIEEYVNLIKSYRKEITNQLIKLNDYFDGTYVSKIEDLLSKFLEAKTYEEMKLNLDFKLPAVPRGSEEEGKKVKNVITDLIKQIKSLMIYETTSEMFDELISTKENVNTIINIIKQLDYRLKIYKQENDIYNFNDIATLAIKVVEENPDVKEELTNSFKEILLDEYQDTSDIQEKFISLISNNNVYMVGDIKQSIYRFRNANPYIFKNKYDTYRDTDQGIKIDLLKNFRSRKEVLENINLLFNLFMDDEIGGAAYKESHQMVFGNNTYIEEGKTDQNYNIDILTYKASSKEFTKDEQEAFIIGKDIINKIKNNYQVFDKDSKLLRNIEYKDFVILLDKSKNFELYKKIFEYLQIPLNILKDESLKKDQDILIIKNLLKLLILIKQGDTSNELKYSYVSIGRSFLYKMKDEEIFNYIATDTYKDSPLYQKCLKLVENIDIMAPSEYINYVLEEFSYDEKLLTIGNIKPFRVREEYIYNLVKSFESQGNTIYDFVDYLDQIFIDGYDLKFSINEENENSCKIMTIHKSKGLEFPICYFAGFNSKFNISELKEKIIFDNNYGIILPKVDNYYKDTILKTLLKETTKKEEISEKIRLLYVALTRAKEKMIIVMPQQEEQQELLDIVSSYERKKYTSFLSIMKSIYTALLPYITEVESSPTKKYLEKQSSETKKLEEKEKLIVEEINIVPEELTEKHYSKQQLHIITKEEQELLDLGTKVHEILEQIDFSDTSTNLELPNHLNDKVLAFVNSDIIKENKNAKFYKEYEFIYTKDNEVSHGIIDLLIETPTKIIIIDYKLKNIEDDAYITQLNGYKDFIQTKTTKEVECYLYSILKTSFKKIC